MADDAVLRLGRAGAEDLYETLWLVAEHHAAGRPIPELPVESDERLGRVMESLRVALGKGRPYDVQVAAGRPGPSVGRARGSRAAGGDQQ